MDGFSEYFVYGNIVYNNGWWAPDRGHGHNFYVQNSQGTKVYKDNIVFGAFGYGTQVYGSELANVDNVEFYNNAYFTNGDTDLMFGGANPGD